MLRKLNDYAAILAITISLFGLVAAWGVTRYQASENAREIQAIKQDFVPRTEFNMVREELKEIKAGIAENNRLLWQHMQQRGQ